MYEKERRALIDCALQMKECRLITLCGGNVCMRLNNGNIAVTPSGMDYEIMTSDDVVIVTPQGKIVEGTRRPTSEEDVYPPQKAPAAPTVSSRSLFACTWRRLSPEASPIKR